MRVINIRQAESSLARLVEAVEKGREREIIIERDGRLVAKLVSIDTVQAGKRIGVAKGKFEMPDCAEARDMDVEQSFVGKAQES